MVTPITYRGLDEKGQEVCSCTAVDANSYINPEEVKAAIENIKSVVESEMKNISKALNSIAPDADSAIIVQGAKITQAIEQICTELDGLANSFYDSVISMYPEAVESHDILQNQANDEAYNAVNSTSGVANVV